MPFESPSLIEEPAQEKEEASRFNKSAASTVENNVVTQIKAYSEHVRDIAAKTGKTHEQIVAEELSQVSKVGINEFLSRNSN